MMTKPSTGVHFLALFVLCGLFLLFASQTRVLFAGYSLADEYELLTIPQHLEQRTVLEEYKVRQIAESVSRFRPLACFLRVFEISIFQHHVKIHRLWRILMGIATAFLFYWFCRRIGWTFFESLLFPCLTLFGQQVWTWWLPSTQEGLGIFFVSCAMASLAYYDSAFPRRHRRWADALFVAGCVLASLSKESFIIVLSGLVFFRVWFLKEKLAWSWWESIRKNLGIGLILGFVCLAELLFIVYVAPGSQGPGYAGFKGILPQALWKAASDLFKFGNGWALVVLFLAAAASGLVSGLRENRKSFGRNLSRGFGTWVPAFVFWFLFAVPNILLHQVSGFLGAYCMPGVLGFSYAIVYLYRTVLAKRSVGVRVAFLVFLSVSVFLNLQVAWKDAVRYTKECDSVEQVFDQIQAHTGPSDPILIAANPARHIETAAAIKLFMELQRDRLNVHYYPVHKPRYTEYEKSLFKDRNNLWKVFQGKVAGNEDLELGRFKVIVVLPTMEFFFLNQARGEFKNSGYRRIKIGDYALYVQ